MSERDGGHKVLVVDDEPEVEPMFRQRMRRELRSGRYEFLFARSGLDALQALDEHPDVRLVITDLNMPGMGGLALLERLSETKPDLRAMVVSAYGDARNVELAMNRGALAFVVKPVDFDEFRDTLEWSLPALK